jgi:hypothetical protein
MKACSMALDRGMLANVGALPRIVRRALAALLVGLLPVLACGGEQPSPNAPTAQGLDLDGDPFALLPAGAVAVLTIDVRTFSQSPAFGAPIGALADAFLPLGADTGFVASRDLERLTVASYAIQGADVVAVVRGRFDPGAIERAAQAHAASSSRSGVLSATPYSGHTMYTVANTGFAALTPHTLLAGTGAGLRLALDRIRDRHVRPELAAPMLDTLRTKDTVAAFAGDFTTSSLASIQGLPIPPWVGAVKGMKGTASLRDPGVQVALDLTFDTAEHATSGADSMRQLSILVNTLAASGVLPSLQGLGITPNGSSVHVSFGLEEATLKPFLTRLPQWLPRANP